MEICDIAALAEAAHRAGALVAVDNTTPTALGQLPLALGADFSVASDTKSISGHSDLLLGHVAVRDPALHTKLDRWRTLTGAVPGPMEAWLALRSVATLPLRLERTSDTALRLAEFLSTRPEVASVLYPGLPSHPDHALAARQMRHFGPVLGFLLKDQLAAETFLRNAALITEATSFGGISTTAERRARWGGDADPRRLHPPQRRLRRSPTTSSTTSPRHSTPPKHDRNAVLDQYLARHRADSTRTPPA